MSNHSGKNSPGICAHFSSSELLWGERGAHLQESTKNHFMHALLISRGYKPRRGVVKSCLICSKEFYRSPSLSKSDYCSKTCSNSRLYNSVEVSCSFCGKSFPRVPSMLKQKNFCSYECSSAWRKEELRPNLVHPIEETRRGGRKRMQDKTWSSKYADKVFSDYIRKRDGKCMRCGRTENLTCSHYWGRSNSGTRYDPDNCDTLCWMPCHMGWEKQKQGDYMQFKLAQLGELKYNELEKRARGTYPRLQARMDCMRLLGVIQ